MDDGVWILVVTKILEYIIETSRGLYCLIAKVSTNIAHYCISFANFRNYSEIEKWNKCTKYRGYTTSR